MLGGEHREIVSEGFSLLPAVIIKPSTYFPTRQGIYSSARDKVKRTTEIQGRETIRIKDRGFLVILLALC